MFSGSGSLRASGEFSLKVKSMWEGSARSRRPAVEWSVMTSLPMTACQAVVMNSPQAVGGYARALTPALSPIETSPYRARDRQRPKWRACLPTASAILAHIMGPALPLPWRPRMAKPRAAAREGSVGRHVAVT